jgi:hypothetical protein
MSELLFAKTLNLLITALAYFGTAFVFLNKLVDNKLSKIIELSGTQLDILVWALISLYIIKMIWFIYSKFYLERRERIANIIKIERENKV